MYTFLEILQLSDIFVYKSNTHIQIHTHANAETLTQAHISWFSMLYLLYHNAVMITCP